jgi:hypothetical protein
MKIKVSSAYCNIRKSSSFLKGNGKQRSPFEHASFSRVCKKIAAKTNNRGERGHLVLLP